MGGREKVVFFSCLSCDFATEAFYELHIFFFHCLRSKCVRLYVQRSKLKTSLRQNRMPLLWYTVFKAVVKEDFKGTFAVIIRKLI